MANDPPDPSAVARVLAAQTASQPSPELDERQRLRDKYQATISRLWTQSGECPICKTDNWNIGDLIETPLRNVAVDLAWAIANTRQVYLYAPVTCTNCGYTMFFHSGALDQHDPKEPS
jgi:predicted nucleic-acid-binding Zn-ribbon protein